MTSSSSLPSSTGITLNETQKLYVIACGSGKSAGYTSMGFRYCFDQATALASRMNSPLAPTEADFGQITCYNLYLELLDQFASHPASKKTWFAPKTAKKVQTILEAARKDHYEDRGNADVLRLFFGDPETGSDWGSENDVVGFIGRSNGMMKVPLLIEPLIDGYGSVTSACGGGQISTNSIVRIINVTKNKEVYRHPLYQLPNMKVEPNFDEHKAEYAFVALKDGETEARFKTEEDAMEYVAFIQGFKSSRQYRTMSEYRAEME